MLIASWNVNSIRSRLSQVIKWLEDEQPEVLCLQETKVSDKDFDNLVEFDLKVVEGIGKVEKIMAELEIEVTSDRENKTKLLGEAKSGITAVRNHFIERMQFVGGFK